MSRSLGFWKRFASYFTKVTQKTKCPTFHTKPKFWLCAVVRSRKLLRSESGSFKIFFRFVSDWAVIPIQESRFEINCPGKWNQVEAKSIVRARIVRGWKSQWIRFLKSHSSPAKTEFGSIEIKSMRNQMSMNSVSEMSLKSSENKNSVRSKSSRMKNCPPEQESAIAKILSRIQIQLIQNAVDRIQNSWYKSPLNRIQIQQIQGAVDRIQNSGNKSLLNRI